jgi:hypothetical protein
VSSIPDDLDVARQSIAKLTQEQKAVLLRELNKSVADGLQRASFPKSRGHDLTPQERKENLRKLMEKLSAMPIESPDDGFSGADHDRVLYGDPQ